MLEPFATRTHEKMKEVLKNPDAAGPKIHYYMVRGGKDKQNITVWETGTVGGEYIKTYGHYHIGDLHETYHIISGEGVVVLQKRKTDDSDNPVDDRLEFFYAIKVKAGDSVYIPSGFGHLVVNTGKVWLVTVDDSPVNFEEVDPVSLPGHADYESVKKMRGFGYYIIDQNGEAVAVPNPEYKELPEVVWMDADHYREVLKEV